MKEGKNSALCLHSSCVLCVLDALHKPSKKTLWDLFVRKLLTGPIPNLYEIFASLNFCHVTLTQMALHRASTAKAPAMYRGLSCVVQSIRNRLSGRNLCEQPLEGPPTLARGLLTWDDYVAKIFKLIKMKYILQSLQVKQVEDVYLLYTKINLCC